MDPIDRLARVRLKPERLAVGLMSGMSMDGVDLALVRIRDAGPSREVDLVAFDSVAYGPALAGRIRSVVGGRTRDVCLLDGDLAEHWARALLGLLVGAGVRPEEVDFLGSHGQTVDHVPRSATRGAATLQVGDADVLAERTGILTVSQFRTRDVAAGGEGAPLVPLADWLLWARPGEVAACHNLGSIANVTVVTERRDDVLAFDTGPANALIDALARRAGAPEGIDLDGVWSAEGSVDEAALAALLAAARPFLERPPPKSAGFDEFGPATADRVLSARAGARPQDLLRTAVEFTAVAARDAYERHVLPRFPGLGRVRFSGGGTRNRTLMARLRARLEPLGLRVEALPDAWSRAKEAIAFALLADETLAGRPGNLPSATGARKPVVLGKISL